MQTSPENDLVTIEEAAAMLGTTTVNILMNLKRNLLQGQEIDGHWHVSKASLAAHGGDTKAAVSKPLCQRSTCGSCGQH
ncbi:hypothetical protein SAMN05660860_02831 [Geoalkalibacter ferrihydriticus]|uniref:Helix-turn-helix domain-containing protein n=2 Tax=Geoalkalibacter ferrihydriticus TaxID=392333 RepID=A0A0C2DRC4_9BACT|nr:hypothetical protein [Geoalkalibacter ferrihydriticus]KIH75994.1 hypothetical protein GFER_13935 [Geoalkalibacter ferrihydriticus DSM 17813]SDM59096.1 hypothetical protein SAMN05660860_02831 [Geoalkalibacter ferrihydriticus]